ncbi:DME family drug/metabolite transporter [Actinoplanes octamycinicus]|uniref:DME family drug/metabolite transporter n=1 Tax=Actinoplanes octamycinicus TaxID=135948 RepID=A0A7W7H8P6_9ACTN|nr:EamA family transporter [Actinoplanes octamycinicus]MBB4745642.1 DME family drug/metabolite transporter [Actinoplanes octamycinicus]GIE56485.1 membrane protein [Actinoplanes octamycinicus]
MFSSSPSAAARLSLVHLSIAGVLWGTAGVVVQVVAGRTGLGAVAIGFYRLLFAAGTMLILGFPARRRIGAAFRSAPAAIVAAGTGLAAYQALYFVAVRLTGVSIATVVSLGLAPLLLSTWETIRTRRRPATAELGASAAAILGLALISGVSAHGAGTLGLLAAIASGTVYAASTALSRRTAQGVPPLILTTLSCTIGAITLAPIALTQGVTFAPAPGSIGLLAHLGAVTTALAYACFYTGLRHTTGSVAVVVTLLEPLTAAVLAVLLIGEPLPLTTIIGGLLLLGAVTTLYLDAARPSSTPEPSLTT